MEQTVVDGNTPYLHQEIIRNILKRLPVKSLIRFLCVCKNWKNLITSPSFIADHLRHYPTHHNPSLLFQRSGSDYGVPLDLCLLDCEKQLHEVQNPPRMDSWSCVRIVGSINGLILYVERSYYGVILSFSLWNPSIRKIRHVSSKDYDFEGDFNIGFGFSPIVNDYKILVAYVPQDEDEVNKVEVYSLSTQSWKKIKFRNLNGVNLYSETVSADGAMFWRGSKFIMEEELDYYIDLVVVFDIAIETFTLIPMPALESNSKDKLTVYENKLGVITLTRKATYFSIDLWVLDEGIGERWSWTKKFSIKRTFLGSPDPLDIWWMDPLCIWGDEMVCNTNDMAGLVNETECEENADEMVINTNDMTQHVGETECEEKTELITSLSLLNLRTNELKKIATSRCGNEFSVIFNHEESLVLVDSIHMKEA